MSQKPATCAGTGSHVTPDDRLEASALASSGNSMADAPASVLATLHALAGCDGRRSGSARTTVPWRPLFRRSRGPRRSQCVSAQRDVGVPDRRLRLPRPRPHSWRRHGADHRLTTATNGLYTPRPLSASDPETLLIRPVRPRRQHSRSAAADDSISRLRSVALARAGWCTACLQWHEQRHLPPEAACCVQA